MLSGNLNAPIDSYPPFPGKERDYLRALLARIQHSTQLCPKGTFEIDEETSEQKLAEEAPSMATEDLKSLESWSHLHPIILKAGRCSHAEPEGLNDEEKEEYMNKLAEDDKVEERFKIIQEDLPVQGYESSWLSKICGDAQQYNKAGGEGTVSYAVNVVQSIRWPGALTVSKSGVYCSIYVGDCIKRGDNTFIPTEPPEVLNDPAEPLDQPEPQGKEKVEKPAEEENKEAEEDE
mmetsp:Transcript_18055/g.30797  ORF Transcript_18055/g.30797 Transcript_18055/m.30797 type:complete len:234 (-) Transcript_18055:60-761(-)